MTSHTVPVRRKALVIALLGALACAPLVQARSISIVPAESLAWGISPNGQVVVGQINGVNGAEAFLWSSLTGMVGLGMLPGGSNSYAYAASDYGRVIVGASENVVLNNEAFLWTVAGGIRGLGFLPGGTTSQASAVNGMGTVIVGHGDNVLGQTEAFRYDALGMAGLGFLSGGLHSMATGVNGDGTVITGFGSNADGQLEAIRWAGGGAAGLGFLPGGSYSEAHAVSRDGTSIAGFGDNNQGLIESFVWQNGSMTGLGFLSGGASSQAYAINADGTVVAGKADDAAGQNLAFRWTSTTGMQSVADWLSVAGANTNGWQLHEASGISADGTVVTGQGTDPYGAHRAFIARVSPGGETGLIDPTVWAGTLGGARAGFVAAQAQQAQSMEGAHHRTLLNYDHAGFRHGVWLSGETATRSEGEGGRAQLAEIGVFTDVFPSLRLGLATAQNRSRQRLDFGGLSRLGGGYWLAEAGWQPAGHPWQLSLTLLAGRWDVLTRRAYSNGGGTDVSEGEAPVRGNSVRLRLDMPTAWGWGKTHITPYVAYAETRTRMAGYAEQGGAFPAVYDAQKDTVREGRIGLRLSRNLTPALEFHSQFEWLHRLDHYGTALSGSEASGLLPFAFPGEPVDQDWLRMAFDLDWKISSQLMFVGALVMSASPDDQAATASISLRYAF